MQGYKQNQKRNYQTNNRVGQKECELGWNCEKILQNKCKFKHDQNDKEDIQSLNRIRKKEIIIIIETYNTGIRPICLFEVFLPIKVIPNEKVKIQVGKYYVGDFVTVKDKCAIIEVKICLGNFGDWKIQRKIFQDHLPPIFEKCKPNENYKQRRGKINVNGALQKVLSGEEGLREYFHRVNERGKYALFEGCQVSYFEKNRTIEISRIKYPQYQKFSGILQIDGSSQFYFIARSETYDEMNPYRIPEYLCQQLKEFIHSIPYTLLKKKELKKQIRDNINVMLRDYLVKGEFKEWPLESRYPIIAIQNEVQTRTFQSEKQGIIYETGIAIRSFSKNEKKQSQKLMNKLKIKDYQKKRQIFNNGKIFTIDSKTTKCHDDAIEILQLEDGDYRVRIHIADIAEVIKPSSSLDKNMKQRDSTLYIRDYFQPMIHQSLRNKLSLKQGDQKLTFTLSFKVSKHGQIDFNSVRFINSIIQVEKNLAHQRLESKAEKYPELFFLSECLEKGDLFSQSSLIDYGSRSEFCMSRIIQLSGIIPTVMMQLNIQRSKAFKQKFDQYIKKIVEQKQKEMEEWQNQMDKINKVRKQLNLTQNKEKKLKKQILKEIQKQREKLIKKIKQEEKSKSQQVKKQKQKKQKKPKDLRKDNESDLLSQDSESETQTELLNEQETLSIGVTEQNHIEDIIEDLNEVLIKEKEKRVKALKQMKNKENFVEISSSESEYSEDESEEDVTLNEGYKMTKAMGGKKFLQKIFSHFKDIKLQWLHESQINDAFRHILKLDKGKLYQQYFKRLQITNRQHFPYIVQKARRQKRQNNRKNGIQQPQKQDKKERRRGRNKKQENKRQNENKREQLQRENRQKQNQKETRNKDQNTKRVQKKKYLSATTSNQPQEIKQNIPQLQPKQNQNKPLQKQEKGENQNQDEKRQLDTIKSNLKGISKNLQRLEENAKFPIMPPSMRPIGMVPEMSPYQLPFFKRGIPECLTKSLHPPFMLPLGMVPTMGKNPPSQIKENVKMPPNYMPPSMKVPPSMQETFQSKGFDFQLRKSKIPRQSKKSSEFSKEQNEKIQQMINYMVSHQEQIQKKYFSIVRNGEELKLQFNEEEKKMLQESQQNFRTQYSSLKKITIIRLFQIVEKRMKKNISQKKIQERKQEKQKVRIIQTNLQQQDSMEVQQKDILSQDYDDDQGLKINQMPSSKKMGSKKKGFDLQFEKSKIPRQIKKKSLFTEEQNQRFQHMVNNLIPQDEQNQQKYFSKIRNGKDWQPQINEQEKEMLEKSQKDFRKQYVLLKRKTIVKLYQLAKQKIKNERLQQQKQQIKKNSLQDPKKQKIENGQKKELLKKQSINLQKEKKQIQKDQRNVQTSVKVKALMKAQTVVQQKVQKDVCQKMVQKDLQTEIQQKVQTGLQQNDAAQPSKNDEQQRQKEILTEEKQICENVQKDQQKQAKTQISNSKPQTKKSKKQINRMIQQLMKPIAEEIKTKYNEQLEKLTEEINKLKKQEADAGKILKLELQKSNIHFNLINLIAHQQNCKDDDESENQSQKDDDDSQSVKGKKTKKNKKKSNKKKKQSKKSVSVFEQILDNFYSYADKSNHDFSIMDDEELDEFLKKQLNFKEIYEQENYSLEKINQQAARIASENMTLKWNNPIRSYESLMVMRLMKQYDWLFQGNIFPTEIVQFGDDLKKLEKKLKKLKQYREDKIANGQNDKKVKQANRQIDYLQFYYKLKKNPDRIYKFLNITSPTPKVKRVFHEILGDVDLQNTKFAQELYKEVKGKVKIVEDFPIKLKIEIIQ